MERNSKVYKFEVIEHIICARPFTTKEEVLELAKKMNEIAQENNDYSDDVKEAFKSAYSEIKNGLTLENLLEIKKIIDEQD